MQVSEMINDPQLGLGAIAPETADDVDDNDYATAPDSMMYTRATAGGAEQRGGGGGAGGGQGGHGNAGGGHGQGHGGGGGGSSTGQAETAQTPGVHPVTGTALPRGTGAGSGGIQRGGRGGR